MSTIWNEHVKRAEELAETFFEWPDPNSTHFVTTSSAILFAALMAEEAEKRALSENQTESN